MWKLITPENHVLSFLTQLRSRSEISINAEGDEQVPTSYGPAPCGASLHSALILIVQSERVKSRSIFDWDSALAYHCANGHTSLKKICEANKIPFIIDNVQLRCADCCAVNPKALPKTKRETIAKATLSKIVEDKQIPLQNISIDIAEFPCYARDGTRYTLSVEDYATRFIWALRLR